VGPSIEIIGSNENEKPGTPCVNKDESQKCKGASCR
jgi:hypothetical protein